MGADSSITLARQEGAPLSRQDKEVLLSSIAAEHPRALPKVPARTAGDSSRQASACWHSSPASLPCARSRARLRRRTAQSWAICP